MTFLRSSSKLPPYYQFLGFQNSLNLFVFEGDTFSTIKNINNQKMMVHITELKRPSWVLVANVVLLKVYHGCYCVASV